MSKKSKLVLLIVGIAAALLIVGAGALALASGSKESYGVQLNRGDKYLAEADYTNAVLAYQAAIASDDLRADGYIGLATVYIYQNKMALAYNILETGINKTGSARLNLMLQTYFSDQAAEKASTQITLAGDKGQMAAAFNPELFDKIASSTYDDYRRNGQIVSEAMNNGVYDVKTKTAGADLNFFNTATDGHVFDNNTGKPFSGKRPNSITLENITVLFGGANTVEYSLLSKAGLSELKISTDETNGYIVSFSRSGCKVSIACDQDGTIHSGAWNTLVPGEAEEVTGAIAVSGSVVSATTGSGVANAEMKIREGASATGTPLQTLKTDDYGKYNSNLDPGKYTVEIRCNGYTTEKFSITVGGYSSSQTENFTITPPLSGDQIRIVLEWGAYPEDLDLWLVGNTDVGADVRVSYHNHTATENGNMVAELDVDDRNGYGPETITLSNTGGDYTICVVDFLETGALSTSSATVKIYMPGQSAPTIVTAGANLANSYGWEIGQIKNGELQVTNTSHDTSSGDIRK